jgi:hypothetical protein
MAKLGSMHYIVLIKVFNGNFKGMNGKLLKKMLFFCFFSIWAVNFLLLIRHWYMRYTLYYYAHKQY